MDRNRIVKTFLALLISCLTLSAATTYPVLTDSTNRLFPGGVTNVFFLNSNVVTTGTMRATGALTLTNSGNVFAGDGSGLTGITGTNSALLNGTNVFTGTNTFEAAKFFPANNIGMRLLWSSPTNIYFPSIVTNAGANLTNNGDFINCSPLATGVLPPLLGSNSAVFYTFTAIRSNANASIMNASLFIGSNTNFVGYSGMAAATAGTTTTAPAHMFQSTASWTNQIVGVNWTIRNYVVSLCDTSVSNTFYLGGWSTAGHTNLFIAGLRIYELYAP